MISFTRGLVLSKGEKAFEFERDIGGGKVQFKMLDTFEVRTFKISAVYKEILKGTIKVVHTTSGSSDSDDSDEPLIESLPCRMTPKQEALIAFRMHYCNAAVRMRAMAGSKTQCQKVLDEVARPKSTDDAEAKCFANFRTPRAPTLMRWLKIYRISGHNPYVLCDRRPLSARPKRLCSRVEEIVEEAIAKHYLQLRGASMKRTCDAIADEVKAVNRSDKLSLIPPSERTVSRRIHEIPEFVRDRARLGIEYARNKWRYSMGGDQSTRILERVEIDHTLLDIWVLDPRSGIPLGRPWVTVVFDRMSRYILGIYVSFYGPSVATVANAIRISILPKDDLIEGIGGIEKPWTAMGAAELYVVDNGLEFHSAAFRRIAWALRADLLYNPVRQPWLKGAIERSMKEFNRILPLPGKVFAPLKNSVVIDPAKSAAIMFDDLCECLIHWSVDVYPFGIHKISLARPFDLWEEGRQFAAAPILPNSLKGLELAAGIATHRTIDGDGVFFQYMRYNSVELQDYCRHQGRSFRTEVRFNPDDLGQMHVHLPKANDWISVPLQRPNIEYGSGLSLLQHQIIRREAGDRLTNANAESELISARERSDERWSEAIRKGKRIKKHAELIRLQGFTSAKLEPRSKRGSAPSEPAPTPEASTLSAESLEKVMPYKSFSLEEEYV